MMQTKLVALAGAGVIAMVTVASLAQNNRPQVPEGLMFLGEPVTEAQVVLGQNIYADNCAACHGADLEGQPDWQRRLDNGRMPAPPHDESGHTWHHSDRNLFIVTRGGVEAVVPGYESDMPAFGETLSDAELVAVLSYLKSTWPERQRRSKQK